MNLEYQRQFNLRERLILRTRDLTMRGLSRAYSRSALCKPSFKFLGMPRNLQLMRRAVAAKVREGYA